MVELARAESDSLTTKQPPSRFPKSEAHKLTKMIKAIKKRKNRTEKCESQEIKSEHKLLSLAASPNRSHCNQCNPKASIFHHEREFSRRKSDWPQPRRASSRDGIAANCVSTAEGLTMVRPCFRLTSGLENKIGVVVRIACRCFDGTSR